MGNWIGKDGTFDLAAYKAAYRRKASLHAVDPESGSTSYQAALYKADAARATQRKDARQYQRVIESRIIDDQTREALYHSVPALDAAREYVFSMRVVDGVNRPTETAALLRVTVHVCIMTRFLIRLQDALDVLTAPEKRIVPRPMRLRYRDLHTGRINAQQTVIIVRA